MLTAEQRRAVNARMARARAEMAENFRLNAEANRLSELRRYGVGDLRRDLENENGEAEADYVAKYDYEPDYNNA